MKKNKSKTALKIILFAVLSIFTFGIGFGSVYITRMMSKVNHEQIDIGDSISQETKKELEALDVGNDIINIALFGVDSRSPSDQGRSDSIMVLTLDQKRKKVKLSSLLRDSYVAIDGHGESKLNHSYAFGGQELAVKTINKNFGLNIEDYVTINYDGLSNIIDSIGGVDIEIQEKEIETTNQYISNVAGLAGLPKSQFPLITKPGMQTLSGIQAVGYSRNRHVGNSDFERTERQRRVLMAILDKVRTMSFTKAQGLINALLPDIVTNLNTPKILGLANAMFKIGLQNLNVEQTRFPTDENLVPKIIDGVDYITFDKATTKREIFDYIFNDIKPE